ncbi:MAG: hypothetical protein KJ548_11875 [Actinobacteria bacterium]|nr:hypothetical protein [Actinomycetota bacterium]MCG2800174.1 hypothetical protein [Cellulomonas sp.]
MTEAQGARSVPDYVGYEYTTVRVARDLESLYRDTYSNFGWIVEGYGNLVPSSTAVSLKLKRDRHIKNRPQVVGLQRKAENALREIGTLERAKTSTAIATAIGVGTIGCAFLAGSVFLITDDQWGWSIPLGALGLLGWLAGFLSYGRVAARRTAELIPLIDRQYDVVYEAGEQAAHLLA